jgi:hypothetical protein
MNAPVSKNSYDSVKMIVYCDIINQIKNYTVVNEIKKSIWRKSFKIVFLTYMLLKIKKI